jgi:glutathione S-transferase
MAPLTLYRGNKSCSFVAHTLLREVGLDFQSVIMKILPTGWESADGTISRDDYRKIHPLGYVPCLVDGDNTITENPAVLTYIALHAPEKNLLGSTNLEKAHVLQWMSWMSSYLHGYGYAMIFRPVRFSDDEAQHKILLQKGRVVVASAYDRIEKHLEGRSFFVVDSATTADFYALIFWYWGRANGFEMEKNYPNYTEFARRMEQKQSVRDAAKDEGIELLTA